VDLVEEGLIELDEAFDRISLSALDRLQRTASVRTGSATVPQLGRLLMWCDERRKVAISDRAPTGWPSVSTRKQALAVDGADAVIDLSPVPAASSCARRWGAARAHLRCGSRRRRSSETCGCRRVRGGRSSPPPSTRGQRGCWRRERA
jgi:hypothetical protein